MGKQAKKKEKSDAQSANQHRHNRATRGVNTNRRLIAWNKDVYYSPGKMWDWSMTHDAVTVEDGTTKLMPKKPKPRLYEPYDRLYDDWGENLRGYAEWLGASVERESLDGGLFRYTVIKKRGRGRDDEIFLSITSDKNYNFGGRKKKRRKKD